ncbi:alpha/beta hydrolase [Ketobacter sp. MCCC 1A13808]|uniref:alpha/beta fold hydrolase n=1 Tax=Ketobacter sp. MCCC 1A13808 TaxID=2602738 RepID=UPI000F28F4C0|nr:alpha/beta hydrolase [Ketobacter sp. MCCC 1A13808]MVF11780.1 alpha/beta hydrolase [Ketobacter sp. MCCC 1A13808]RLP55386.1 MAG: alpha/beta hydrolase [Ketobacter sp.]
MKARHWVLLRGLVRQHRHWEQFPQLFQQAFPEAELHLLDLPGNGDLCHCASPVHIRGMVDVTRTRLQADGVREPVNLLAISLGGMVSIEWMKRYPDEINAAVIINSSLRGMGTLFDRLRPENYPAILKTFFLQRSIEAKERLILGISSNLYPDKAQLAQTWAQYASEQPTSTKNAVRQLLAATRYRAPEQIPHNRVLLLKSIQDRLVNPVCTERMAEQWGWPVRVHPQAGHDLPLDDAEWVIKQIQNWILQPGKNVT